MKDLYKLVVMLLFAIMVTTACVEDSKNKMVAVASNEHLAEDPINDAVWLSEFEKKASAFYKANGGTNAKTYKSQLLNKGCNVNALKPINTVLNAKDLNASCKAGVLMMGKMYNCGHCPNDHISIASAFVISEDGVCVTNYHVFKSYDPARPNDYITFFVMDTEKNIYPVLEVLAASKHDDLSIFKIDTKGHKMKALPLGNQQEVGSSVNLISHPDQRLYRYSQGCINRTYLKPGTAKLRQSISADFASGSSGAPILDDCGNVIGVVAGTQNITYGPKEGIYQMTINEMIPVSRLRELIEK